MVSEIMKLAAEWCALIVEAIGIGVITSIALYGLVFALTLEVELTGRWPWRSEE